MESQRIRIGRMIRTLRIQKKMTQAELAQGCITRNMLSLIENGNATPSLDTITEIASRLQVPVGYFFAANEEESSRYSKMGIIDSIYASFRKGDFKTCHSLCLSFPSTDPEISRIQAECALVLAGEACKTYAISTALRYLSDSVASSQNLYCAQSFASTANFLGLLIRSSNAVCIPEELGLPHSFPESRIPAELFLFLRALFLADSDKISDALCLAESGMLPSCYSNFIRAHSTLLAGDYTNAEQILKGSLEQNNIGFFTKYHILCDLEQCATATKKFEHAYRYSTQKVQLMDLFSK